MLDGVTPFPAEFAARYRALGYWQDRPLFDGFTAALAAYADRVALDEIRIDPDDPALFLLSGGTTGIPKLIPRTHNDYLYNSRAAAAACEIGLDDVLLDVLPIQHPAA